MCAGSILDCGADGQHAGGGGQVYFVRDLLISSITR